MSGINKNEIDRWLREGLITAEQAKKMLEDAFKAKEQHSSNYAITIISIIGSALIGLGAILVVKSNWGLIPDMIKIGTLLVSTIAAYATGYYCKYRQKTLPIVGSSLLLLGALLFGATVLLTGYVYGFSLHDHRLSLIWLLGIIPAVYAFASGWIAVLTVGILMWWLFEFYHTYFVRWEERSGIGFTFLFLVVSIFLYNVGTLHYLWDRFKKIGFVYKILGINILLFALLELALTAISGSYTKLLVNSFAIALLVASGIALALALLNYFYNSGDKKADLLEVIYTAVVLLAGFLLCFFPSATPFYPLLFSFLFTQIIFLVIFAGYCNRSSSYMMVGIMCLAYALLRYYLQLIGIALPRGLFLILAGAILVAAGIVLEKKRRDIKAFSPQELQDIKKIFFVTWLALFAVLALFILMKQPNVGRVGFF